MDFDKLETLMKLMKTYNITLYSSVSDDVIMEMAPQKQVQEYVPEEPKEKQEVYMDPDFYAHLPQYTVFSEEKDK